MPVPVPVPDEIVEFECNTNKALLLHNISKYEGSCFLTSILIQFLSHVDDIHNFFYL